MDKKALFFLSAAVVAFLGLYADAGAVSKNVDTHGSASGAHGIAWVGFSGATFVGGSGSARSVVGKLGAIMNPVSPAAACVWSIAGADASKFAVNSATGAVSVGAADLPLGKYGWDGICTQTGAVMSPFLQHFTVQAVASTAPTIEMIGGPVFNIGDKVQFNVKNAPADYPGYPGSVAAFFSILHGHMDGEPGHNFLQGAPPTVYIPAGTKSTTVSFTIPDFGEDATNAYEHHLTAHLTNLNYSSEVAESGWFGVNPKFDRQPPTTASPGFVDPFVPAHTVTVCPARCDYSSISSAMASVSDYTLIKVKAIRKGFYRDCISVLGPLTGGPGGGSGGPNITHLWIKGVSDDGDFVHLQGHASGDFPWSGYRCVQPGSSTPHGVVVIGWDPQDFTLENFEIDECDGESNEGCIYLIGRNQNSTIRLRNVYLHDGEDLVSLSGDNEGLNLTVENSHFARGGHNYGGWQHNLYIGGCEPALGAPCVLNFNNNVSEMTVAAHELKTRESTSRINCNLFKESYSSYFPGSADIDFSEGREAVLTNNVIAMGPNANPNNNDFVRWGLDQEHHAVTPRYLSLINNTFINDGGYGVGYIEYGPRPGNLAGWHVLGQVPPGNSTNNTWIGPVGAFGLGPIVYDIPTAADTPFRQNKTHYRPADIIKVPDNPTYLFTTWHGGTTAASEPAGLACPSACPQPHGTVINDQPPPTQVTDGSVTWVPIPPAPGYLPVSGEKMFATRSAAGLGPNDFRVPAACTKPVGNVAVPSS